VANAISLPLTGWLTQRYGAVRLFTASILLFVLASLACGLAPSIELLIFFRIIQGAVAGPMIPLSQTLLLASYPKEKAGMALAMWSMTTLVAPVAGPLLGGWITDNISWPWIFYINIPVGLGAAAATWFIYRTRETETKKLPIDAVGLGLLVVWVGALQVMFDKGKDLDWFNSGTLVALSVTAALGLALFVVWELTDEHPVVDLRLFKRRNFTMGAAALSLGYGVFFGNVVLLPLWLQQYMGYTATLAGMALAPVGFLAILLSPLVGRNVSRIDPRFLGTTAFAIFAIVMLMRSHFNTQVDFVTLMIPTVIQGAALAFFFIPLVTITLSGIGPQQMPAASGLSNFLRISAGSFGTSISTTLWDHRATMHHAQLVEKLTPYDPATSQALANLQAGGFSLDQSLAQLNRLVDQQAALLSANDIFYGSAMLFLAMIGLVWLSKPGKATASAEAAGAH
ncbi:MAG TPA: DHA2 family efflux MFS transporter permease subunit, partial [Usitatibacter sp.]|nr:DHA2 family efflux MFS transporter permease subunit [Usitatibacter sp.]